MRVRCAGNLACCNIVISRTDAARIIRTAGDIPVFGKGGVAKAGEKEWKRAVAAGAGAAGIETEEIVMSVKDKVLAFFREEEGLTAVEYAVAGAVVASLLVAAFIALRGEIINVLTGITEELKTVQ